jgi:hypothetical protein
MILFVFFSLLLFGCGKFEELVRGGGSIRKTAGKKVCDCHAEIFKEWEKRRHAKAWVSEQFRLESENYTKNKRLSCHAPIKWTQIKNPF